MEQVLQDYRDALEQTALIEEVLATQFTMLADELEKQGQHQIAELLQVASRRHRASSIKSRAIAVSLDSSPNVLLNGLAASQRIRLLATTTSMAKVNFLLTNIVKGLVILA